MDGWMDGWELSGKLLAIILVNSIGYEHLL